MQPKEIENKMREFLNRELGGEYYQCVISFTDGKPDPENPTSMKIGVVAISNANPSTAPFAAMHGLMKALRMHFRNIHAGLYGGDMKQEDDGMPERFY